MVVDAVATSQSVRSVRRFACRRARPSRRYLPEGSACRTVLRYQPGPGQSRRVINSGNAITSFGDSPRGRGRGCCGGCERPAVAAAQGGHEPALTGTELPDVRFPVDW